MIVPFPPGGLRILPLAPGRGHGGAAEQPVAVVNKAGAGGWSAFNQQRQQTGRLHHHGGPFERAILA